MQVLDLGSLGANTTLETDLVIIGGGPAGLTIGREFFGTATRVLILESGAIEEDPRFTSLNAIESVGEPKTEGPVSENWVSYSGRPFGLDTLKPYINRVTPAQRLSGSKFQPLTASAHGCERKLRVLAASGIENPRLLLISNHVHTNALGNQNDVVGRFLMDHPRPC